MVAPGIQNPDRSGWPSAVRGGGAFMSILPSLVRGTSFHGYDGHCASTVGVAIHATAAHTSAKRAAFRTRPGILPPITGGFYLIPVAALRSPYRLFAGGP